MNLHLKIANFVGRLTWLNVIEMTPIFFVIVLILEIGNLPSPAWFDDFSSQKYVLKYIAWRYFQSKFVEDLRAAFSLQQHLFSAPQPWPSIDILIS